MSPAAPSGRSGWGFDRVPEPFFDMASQAMPRSMPNALRWCEFLLSSQGVYLAALGRIVSYFMTDVAVAGEDLSEQERKNQKAYLVDQLHVMDHLKWERMDAACYGNSFRSVVESFTRHFSCPHPDCRLELTIDALDRARGETRWEWSGFAMNATCPRCARRSTWKLRDRRAGGDSDLTIKAWSPHEITIEHDKYSGRNGYVWDIPEDYRRQVARGDFQVLRNCPAEVIAAVKAGANIRFKDDCFFHGRTQTFAGVDAQGWGIPRVLTNFRLAWYFQLLHRYNEAIALDYVLPIRVLTPDGRPGATPETSDPILGMNLGAHRRQVADIVSAHRADPTQMHYLPFPIKYQTLGGEASQLAPFQLIDQALDTLLNAIDTPVELYKMSLSSQDAPARLRLFEAIHRDIPSNSNRFLAFVMRRAAQHKDWPKGDARLLPVTLVDDLTKQDVKLQAVQAGVASPTTMAEMVGLDAQEEFRKSLDFQQWQQEEQQRRVEQMEARGVQAQIAPSPLMAWTAAQQPPQGPPGAPAGPAGAAPPPGGPAAAGFAAGGATSNVVPQSPEETLQRARTIAQSLVAMPESQKNTQLRQLKQTAPLLHDAVVQALEDVRDDAARQGRDMVLQKQGRGARGLIGLLSELP